jgi:hypothetical protein
LGIYLTAFSKKTKQQKKRQVVSDKELVCFLHRRVGMNNIHTYPLMKMGHTVCSETLVSKLQTPVNHPEEGTHSLHHGGSSKSRINNLQRNIRDFI